MKESMPSRVQPVQAAQKPVICARDSLVCGCAAANAAFDMLLMTLFSLASLYWLFSDKVPLWRIGNAQIELWFSRTIPTGLKGYQQPSSGCVAKPPDGRHRAMEVGTQSRYQRRRHASRFKAREGPPNASNSRAD